MTWWFIVGIYLLFIAINICVAELNDSVRRKRIKNGSTKQIEHFWYGLGYCIVCGGIWYISKSWIEFGSLLLQHISIFPVAYNRFADQPAFHLSTTSSSLIDKTMVRLGLKSTEEVNIIAFCISIVLLTYQLFVK